ncbi:MAG: IS1595 family transposase [Beijerinckiaceae bacterium]
MATDFNDPIYQNADAARKHLEKQRWPNGPECPHCGNVNQNRIKALAGKSHRPGLYQCAECREQFTVTVGTVFERSKIPLNKWLFAVHLMTASKKGISAHQVHRMLGVTYKSAWFMCHRIREAMISDTASSGPIGGAGMVIEADETYYGKQGDPTPSPQRKGRPYINKRGSGPAGKRPVVALVERGGSVRSFHVASANILTVSEIIFKNANRKSTLFTDESALYTGLGKTFAGHDTVEHSADEYVRGAVHTNTIENVFSVFKRGMRGVYQHCGEKHLQRYLTEFDFRYNTRAKLEYTDAMRRDIALSQIGGKRLTYRRIGGELHA